MRVPLATEDLPRLERPHPALKRPPKEADDLPIRSAIGWLYIYDSEDCSHQVRRVCCATIVLVRQLPGCVVPPLPVLFEPGHSHIPQPPVVLVLRESPLNKVEGKLLACEIKCIVI